MVEPLGEVLVLRAYSGPFTAHEERRIEGFPDVVIFDDGQVVAGTTPDLRIGDRPDYQTLTLSPEDLEELNDQLRGAALNDLGIGDMVGGSICDDCGTTILRTDIGGETVEIAAFGLVTDAPETYVQMLPYSEQVIALDRTLNAIAARVAQDGVEWDGDVPTIPISASTGG